MADLIDRATLIEKINAERQMSKTSCPKRSFVVGDTLQCIYDAPTIDPESLRRQGEWECEHETWGQMQCSICKKGALLQKSDGDIRKTLLYVTSNYCPNCGAKMKGAGN